MQETVHIPETRDKETASLKMPPHSIEAEISVLGGLMTDNSAWDKVAEYVSEEDFYRKKVAFDKQQVCRSRSADTIFSHHFRFLFT